MTAPIGRVDVLHYSSGQWRPVDIPALDEVLNGPSGTGGGFFLSMSMQMFGPSAGWMFALSAVSANEAWIVDTDFANGGNLTTLFAHYVKGAWSLWPKTFAGDADQSITMLSPSDGWAAYSANVSGQTVLLH